MPTIQYGSEITKQCLTDCVDVSGQVHDINDLTSGVTASLSTNVSGTVKVLFKDSTVAVPRYMIAGVEYPWRIKRIYSTGSDAGSIAAGKIFGGY